MTLLTWQSLHGTGKSNGLLGSLLSRRLACLGKTLQSMTIYQTMPCMGSSTRAAKFGGQPGHFMRSAHQAILWLIPLKTRGQIMLAMPESRHLVPFDGSPAQSHADLMSRLASSRCDTSRNDG